MPSGLLNLSFHVGNPEPNEAVFQDRQLEIPKAAAAPFFGASSESL